MLAVEAIDVKFIFDSARLGLSSSANIVQISRCRPSSCLLAVLVMFLLLFRLVLQSWNERNVRHFCFHNQNNSTSSPGLLVNGALTHKKAALLTSSVH